MSELEKEIVAQDPDFEHQRQVLDEEKEIKRHLKNFYMRIAGIFFCMFLIILVAYFTIDFYIEYSMFGPDACENVNIDVGDEEFKTINLAVAGSCVPEYNIDYFNNRKVTFNIDLYGDKSLIYNKTNQMDPTGTYCILNCDANADGWPDYNIDLNGDGVADINIVKDPQKSTKCDLNCDINFDTIPDTNIDTNGDGIADVNITGDDINKPLYNIDYKGNRVPTFNIKDDSGNVTNSVGDGSNGKACDLNCDLDGDGWPDYNIKLTEDGPLLNELISSGNTVGPSTSDKKLDWKCFLSKNLAGCLSSNNISHNKYINIDVDGDGVADVNLSSDHGENITNPINNKVQVDGKEIILNEDKDNDGFPDYNIDIDGDGKPDLNITNGKDYTCQKNCDTNHDGKPDYNIDYNDKGTNLISIKNINIDIDYDGICDVNCDLNYDLYPDINVDINKDNIPDINIDYDGDGIPDFNIDTNGDGKPDKNLSAYLDGKCNFNCEDNLFNMVDSSTTCTRNCDTDNDGWPDMNVDVDGDGYCDFNCDNGEVNVDKNHDYYLDSEDHTKEIVIDKSAKDTFYILNPIDITADSIEPGWNDKYVLKIRNNTQYALSYRIVWREVLNEFTDENNLDYSVLRNGSKYFMDLKAPRNELILKDNILIRAGTSISFVMDMSWKDTGLNQNIDSAKAYKGKLKIEVIK